MFQRIHEAGGFVLSFSRVVMHCTGLLHVLSFWPLMKVCWHLLIMDLRQLCLQLLLAMTNQVEKQQRVT
jgi:hypothetical protein